MARNIKLSDGSTVRYPDEDKLKKIVEKLSSDDVIGSTVLSSDASEADKIKYNLCAFIVKYKIEKKINQKDLAEKLGLDEPETSRVLHYKIERYSIERLLGYAKILYPKLTIEVLAA